MSQAAQTTAIQSVVELLSQVEIYQREKSQPINPRLHTRKGVKRNVDFYVLCRRNPTTGNPEVAISGPKNGINLVQAEVFINPAGLPQVKPVTIGGFDPRNVDKLVYEALNLIIEKAAGDELDFYNPHLDGFYIIRRNPGRDGKANMVNAKKAKLISADFEQVMVSWKFSMSERHPDVAYIAKKKKSRKV